MDILPLDTPQKQCSTCLHSYPATPQFFCKDRTKQDGLHTTCKVCNKARCKAYREAHKEQVREQERLYRQAHKEQLAAYIKQWQQENDRTDYKKQWHQAHKEELNARAHERYLSQQEERRARARRYGKTEQGRLVSKTHKSRRKAQKRASAGSYTAKQLQEQFQRQKGKCYWCKVKLGKTWHADHVIPLAKGGSNTIDNIVAACPTCNMRRKDKLPHEWPEGGRLL